MTTRQKRLSLILIIIFVLMGLIIILWPTLHSSGMAPTSTPPPLKPTETPDIPDPSDYCYWPEIPDYSHEYCQMVYVPMVIR